MPASRLVSSLVAALTLALSTITATGAIAAAPGGGFKAMVISVGDGHTLRVSTGSRPLTVRLGCIDAPETAQSPWGMQSRAYLPPRLPRGGGDQRYQHQRGDARRRSHPEGQPDMNQEVGIKHQMLMVAMRPEAIAADQASMA